MIMAAVLVTVFAVNFPDDLINRCSLAPRTPRLAGSVTPRPPTLRTAEAWCDQLAELISENKRHG
jgi:hypothetical protein